MASLRQFCKAYLLQDLRRFGGWKENAANARPEEDEEDGEDKGAPPRVLDDESIVYLHDNYVVTDGIYEDEYVLFDQVDEAWRRFCREELDFVIPDYMTGGGATEEEAAAGAP